MAIKPQCVKCRYWKRIWQTVTAKNKHISNKAVITDLLAGVGKDLCDGLVVYGAFTKTEFELWIKEMKMGESNRLFERFFFRVCKKLVNDDCISV